MLVERKICIDPICSFGLSAKHICYFPSSDASQTTWPLQLVIAVASMRGLVYTSTEALITKEGPVEIDHASFFSSFKA